MAMKDINGEEFKVGDTLKVIKYEPCGVEMEVGDVVKCIKDDNTNICRFKLLSNNQRFYYFNYCLQKL